MGILENVPKLVRSYTIMMQEMGQDGFAEWMSNLGETFRGVESMTLRHRPDLSVPGN